MWPWLKKMGSAMDKCLAFCQALVSSGQKFTLNLSIGDDKLFFSNKELKSSWKKKKSPSQVRREKKGKEIVTTKPLKKWLMLMISGQNSTAAKAEAPAVISCEECDYKATTEKGGGLQQLWWNLLLRTSMWLHSKWNSEWTNRWRSNPCGGRAQWGRE